jgi:hypothetical protein
MPVSPTSDGGRDTRKEVAMSRVIPLSRYFLSGHPRRGQPTYFVEQFLSSIGQPFNRQRYALEVQCLNPWMTEEQVVAFVESLQNIPKDIHKHHTVRAGCRWKKGDMFSPRAWSGKPYASKQIIIWQDTPVVDTFSFKSGYGFGHGLIFIDGKEVDIDFLREVATNDGLAFEDFWDWIIAPTELKDFDGQIICWNKNINYE